MDVAECRGNEGFETIPAVFVFKGLVDVEELVPRATKKSHCLFGFGGHGEVKLRPKAWSGHQHVPPGSTDVCHLDQGFVHRECGVFPVVLVGEEMGNENEDVVGQPVYGR